MSIIKEIETQYFEIENDYYSKEFNSHIKNHYIKEAFWRKKRELFTHAYFLFLFTRLEDHIRKQSENLIQKRRDNITNWKTKAIWDIPDLKNLYFKNRLALLTEKGNSNFNKVIEYYDLRNKIGHGETISDIHSEINMINVFDDMNKFIKELKR